MASSEKEEDVNKITILSVHQISSYPFVKYLQARRISFDIADKFLKEVRLINDGKTYYALGFKNDAGGYELRNESFKGSSSPKDISFIDNGACNVAALKASLISFRTAQFITNRSNRCSILWYSTPLLFLKNQFQKCWNMTACICTWTMMPPDKNAVSWRLI